VGFSLFCEIARVKLHGIIGLIFLEPLCVHLELFSIARQQLIIPLSKVAG